MPPGIEAMERIRDVLRDAALSLALGCAIGAAAGVVMLVLGTLAEIGRASCRERV